MIFKCTNAEINFLNHHLPKNDGIWNLNDTDNFNLNRYKEGVISLSKAKRSIKIHLGLLFKDDSLDIMIDEIKIIHPIQNKIILKLAQRIQHSLRNWANQNYQPIIDYYLRINDWQQRSYQQMVKSSLFINQNLTQPSKDSHYQAKVKTNELAICHYHDEIGVLTDFSLNRFGRWNYLGSTSQTVDFQVDKCNLRASMHQAQALQAQIGKQFPTCL